MQQGTLKEWDFNDDLKLFKPHIKEPNLFVLGIQDALRPSIILTFNCKLSVNPLNADSVF